MRFFDKTRLRLRSLFRRESVDSELDAEMRFHLDQLTEENLAAGMAPKEARMAARRAIGGMTQFQQECRDMRRVNLLEETVQDVRYAVRSLAATPGFAAVVIATLALGIGGITAVFSVVDGVLLAPLPYEEPGRLVRLYQQEPNDPSTQYFLSGAYFSEIRERATAFENVVIIANYSETGLDLVAGNQGRRLRTLGTTSEYFEALIPGGLRGPGFGREQESGEKYAILSDALWRREFGGDPAVIGSTVRLSADPYIIAGVAPEGFEDPVVGAIDAWLPYNLASDTEPENYGVSAVGRLRRGVTIEQARAELAALSQSLAERWPNVRRSVIAAEPLKEDLVSRSRGTLNVLTAAVGLVLLIACLNVANLFLVRASGRLREFAVRSALGSGGWRIARQLLVESVLLASAGGLAGLALAGVAIEILRRLGGDAIPRLGEVELDPVVLAVTAAVTLATGLAFGMAPALRFSRIAPSRALHQQSRWSTGGRGQGRLRNGQAVLQVALALILLVGAGVLTASFYRLQQIELGFRTDDVMTFELVFPTAHYDAARRAIAQEELARRIESIPGVKFAGATSRLPAAGNRHPWATFVLSGPRAGQPFALRGQQRVVAGHFFEAMEIPLLAGRVFDGRDEAGAPMRAVISASAARQAFPGLTFDQVLGQRILIASRPRDVIGVVGDVTLDAHGTPTPSIYTAHRQFAANRNWDLTHVAATKLPPEQVTRAIRAEVAAMDPELVVYGEAPLADVVGRGVARERFALVLMGAFGAVALALAAIGLYGVLAYSVRQRTQEMGIRMALGARPGQVRGLVLRQAAAMVVIGVALGIAGALAMGRWLSALVYQTSPQEPRVFVATTCLLILVALLAAWLPAWRASRVDPASAMHEE